MKSQEMKEGNDPVGKLTVEDARCHSPPSPTPASGAGGPEKPPSLRALGLLQKNLVTYWIACKF